MTCKDCAYFTPWYLHPNENQPSNHWCKCETNGGEVNRVAITPESSCSHWEQAGAA